MQIHCTYSQLLCYMNYKYLIIMKKRFIITFVFFLLSVIAYNQGMVGLKLSEVINLLSKEGFQFEFSKKKMVELSDGDTIIASEYLWTRLGEYGLVREYEGIIFEEENYLKGFYTLDELFHPVYGYVTTYSNGFKFRGFFVNKKKICYFIKRYSNGLTHFTAVYTTWDIVEEKVTPEQYSKLVAMSLF